MKAPVVGSWALAVRGNLVVQNGVNVSVMNVFFLFACFFKQAN